MVREMGLDLRCGGGRLGLRHAPGMSPSALGFKSQPGIKKQPQKATVFYMVREMGLEPTRLWLDTGTSSLPVYLFQHSRVCPKARAIILMGSGNVKQKDYLQRKGFPLALKSAIRLKRAASGVSSGAFCLTAAVIRSGFTTGSEADTVTRTRTAFSSGINERPRI